MGSNTVTAKAVFLVNFLKMRFALAKILILAFLLNFLQSMRLQILRKINSVGLSD